jgi:energy-coupling factor transporter ATP-binding protein EcfA2
LRYWVFVATSHKRETEPFTADQILDQRFADRFWGLGSRTAHRRSLSPGDQIIFYSGLPRKSFVALAELESASFKLTEADKDEYGHEKEFYRSDYGVRLKNIKRWAEPLRVDELAERLSFIGKPERWGAYFQGGVVQISEQDFRFINEKAGGSLQETERAISGDKIDRLLHLVRKRYPNWQGFSDPDFVKDEIDYKQATALKSRELLGKAEVEALIDDKNFDELIGRIERLGKHNNLLWNHVPKDGDLSLLYQDNLDKPAFCAAMLELLHGQAPSPARLARFVDFARENQLAVKWTFITYFLFFSHPETEIFIKPAVSKWLLEFWGPDYLWTSIPTPEIYLIVQRIATQIQEQLKELGPADMIDIQSLVWVAADAAKHETKALKETTRENVLAAMAKFDGAQRLAPEWLDWEQRQTYKYAIDNEAQLYPAKEILSMASGVPVQAFSGGEQTNKILQARGFTIKELEAKPQSYWKIAPGDNASNWPACRDGGYIAVGWDELGDVSELTPSEFEIKRARLEPEMAARGETGWSKQGANQLLVFAHKIKEGDLIIANNGTKAIVGIGKVVGSYYFVPGGEYGHRLPVEWKKMEPRAVNQPGWKKTLIKLSPGEWERPMSEPTQSIYSYMHDEGFSFPMEVLTNYALSLGAKPFVILTGISGTGKTKIAQLFAEYMHSDESGRIDRDKFAFVSVRPDWIDSRGLLGFYNLITQKYQPTALLKLMMRASGRCWQMSDSAHAKKRNECLCDCGRRVRNRFVPGHDGRLVGRLMQEHGLSHTEARERVKAMPPKAAPETGPHQVKVAYEEPGPYFAVLDEMNLARVEQYFSDFLSCLETRRLAAAEGVAQEALVLHDQPEPIEFKDSDGFVYEIPPTLEVPTSLYFTGTVNIDETTHMFSPKVLDRASVIEFNEVNLADYGKTMKSDGQESDFALANVEPTLFADYRPTTQADFLALGPEYRHKLKVLNDILKEHNRHFGYRVANEIARYIKLVEKNIGPSQLETAFDLQILQRVLPKLHGTRAQLEQLLRELRAFAFTGRHEPRLAEELAAAETAIMTGYDVEEAVEQTSETMPDGGKVESALDRPPLYPRTAQKLDRMLQTLKQQGFVSFIE